MSNSQNSQNNFSFDVEVGKILNLMINSLYANKDVALRELVSNASDACDKLRYLATQKPNLLCEELKINITTNKSQNLLIISDNGIGMNKPDLINNLGTIARSGTENFLQNIAKSTNPDEKLQLIGQFGVGFYASFMIANKVEVLSRKAEESELWLWQSEGNNSFSIDLVENNLFDNLSGTKIILHLKEEAKEFLDRFHIKHIIQTYSDHINFPICFIPENINEGATIETLNSASALWKKPSKEITKEQYQNFYKHISHLPGEPFLTLHNTVEGNLSYTNLLFIPSTKPFDLFHPDRKTSLKLYVKKVFISENLNLVPAYLRFLKGLVDSDDLPLNISRETLQHNAVLDKIKKSLISKVLSELKKVANNTPEKYQEFWQNFGAVLKEGLCEPSEFREKILETCLFYTSKSTTIPISLATYLGRISENQKQIFFLTGENITKIQSSPQLEIFQKKDIEVLFLTDAVDEFWVTVATIYQEKEFQSINRTDINLDEIKSDITQNPESTNSHQENQQELLTFFKDCLQDNIKEVRISKKLTNSPVCLAIDAYGMDIRLERFLLEQKQLNSASAKILEINLNNKIIQKISDNFKQNPTQASNMVKTLFDLACVVEDEPLKDAYDFSQRIQNLLA
jgi:molecular chaperone HtpG